MNHAFYLIPKIGFQGWWVMSRPGLGKEPLQPILKEYLSTIGNAQTPYRTSCFEIPEIVAFSKRIVIICSKEFYRLGWVDKPFTER